MMNSHWKKEHLGVGNRWFLSYPVTPLMAHLLSTLFPSYVLFGNPGGPEENVRLKFAGFHARQLKFADYNIWELKEATSR